VAQLEMGASSIPKSTDSRHSSVNNVMAAGEIEKTEVSAPFVELSKITSTLVLVSIFLAILMGAMDALIVATVLPTIAGELHQVNGVTFVAGAYLISSTISIPIFAKLSDISSRRNVFLIGLRSSSWAPRLLASARTFPN